jgi:hypothetical protein
MQVTIDIPEPQASQLQERAVRQHRPIEEVVLGELLRSERIDGVQQFCEPGILVKMNINLNDLMLMTDDEMERLERALEIDPEAAVKEFGLRRLGEDA